MGERQAPFCPVCNTMSTIVEIGLSLLVVRAYCKCYACNMEWTRVYHYARIEVTKEANEET